jgi:hypothetical protein
LNEKYGSEEEEWEMIARKAKNYLKAQGLVKIEPILKTIKIELK